MLGNDDPQAAVPGEIVVTHKDGFYSYEAKYVDPDGSHIRIPADIPAETAARVRAAERGDLPRRWSWRAWPGWTSSSTARPARCTSTR